jgi:tryptophan-rich sensory protein
MSSPTSLVAFLILTFLAPLAGAFLKPDAWYFALAKPLWTPPPWIFGPAWTLLYAMMAVAAWVIWKRDGFGRPLQCWTVQLLLNAAWTPVFFGMHRIGAAALVITGLWLAIVGTIALFTRVNRLAAGLLLPYLGWVSFAWALNFAIWRLNP